MKRLFATTVLLLLPGMVLPDALAQTAAPPAPAPCASTQSHQFDFWLGQWTVRAGPGGDKFAGHSRIERSDNGCWIVEHWHGASGNHGTSLNAWDAQHQVWRQFWVGGDGVVLRLSGGMADGSMVLAGEQPGKAGGVQLQRITWTPNDDGSVTQQWDTSDDAGKTWQVAFRGNYRHPDPVAAPVE